MMVAPWNFRANTETHPGPLWLWVISGRDTMVQRCRLYL
jgi:hypothetical protein